MAGRVQRRLDDLVGDGAEIGLQVAACVDGQLALDAWAGVADRATGRPVDGETPFTVFSATKGVARRLLARGAPGAASPLAPSTPTGYAGGPARGLGSGHFRPRAVGRLREGAMRYRRLGRTGVQLSRFSLGASFFGTRIGRDEAAAILHRALDLGVNVVDTAESYLRPEPLASEAVLGEILPGVRRDLFLATKVGPARTWEEPAANQGLSRRVVMQALDGSLRRLKTDHVDLLYAHFPDPATPLEETLGAIEDLVRAGKVRYAGLSNHSAARVAEALWTADRHGWRPIVATQDLYNLFERVNEHDLYPLCERHGIGAFAYAPLAGGLLTGKYSLEMAREASAIPAETRAAYYGRAGSDAAPARSSPRLTEPTVRAAQRVGEWAEARGHRAAHVALAWAAGHPAVTSTLLGVTTLAQLNENVPALDLELSPAERAEVADLLPRGLVNRVHPTW